MNDAIVVRACRVISYTNTVRRCSSDEGCSTAWSGPGVPPSGRSRWMWVTFPSPLMGSNRRSRFRLRSPPKGPRATADRRACEAGVEFRPNYSVESYLSQDDRITGIHGKDMRTRTVSEEQAQITIDADGRNALLARTVGTSSYVEAGVLACCTSASLSGWYRNSGSGCQPDRASSVTTEPPTFRTSFENHSAPGGRWSEMRGATRTRSSRSGSVTRSGTPNCSAMLSTRVCPERVRSRKPSPVTR